MPRYYFDVRDGVQSPDHDGIELTDLEAAREEAVRLTGEMLKEDQDFWRTGEWHLEVLDADRKPLFGLDLSTRDHDRFDAGQ